MINARVFKLKQDVELKHGLKFLKDSEIEVVQDMVYMGGFPLPPQFQEYLYGWIIQNQNLLEDVTKNWK